MYIMHMELVGTCSELFRTSFGIVWERSLDLFGTVWEQCWHLFATLLELLRSLFGTVWELV